MFESLFKRLRMPNASAIDDTAGLDALQLDNHYDDLEHFEHEHVVNRRHGQAVTYYRGDLLPPFSQEGPEVIDIDARVPVHTASYGRVRHGEGLWGIEPLIPEGETT